MEEQNQNFEQEYNPVPHEELVSNKKNWLLIILGVVVFAGLIGGGIFWRFQNIKIVNIIVENDVNQESSLQEHKLIQTKEILHKKEYMLAGLWCYFFNHPEDENYNKWKSSHIPSKAPFCDIFEEKDYQYFKNLLNTDEDGDGLNSYFEIMHSTDDKKSDTDSDGFNDFEEVYNNHNPNNLLDEGLQEGLVKFYEAIRSEMSQNEFIDLDAVVDICNSLVKYQSYIDNQEARVGCFREASQEVFDVEYCNMFELEEFSGHFENACIENDYVFPFCISNTYGFSKEKCISNVESNIKRHPKRLYYYLGCYLEEDSSFIDNLSTEERFLYPTDESLYNNTILGFDWETSPLAKFSERCNIYTLQPELKDYVEYLLYTDEDRDGLSLFLEFPFRMDDNNIDTNGDGIDDYTEFKEKKKNWPF